MKAFFYDCFRVLWLRRLERNASGEGTPFSDRSWYSGPFQATRYLKSVDRAWLAACLSIFFLLAGTAAQAAVTVNKAFAPSSMSATGTSTLTITLANTATSAATSAAFTDTLPSGLTVASPSNIATTCSGTATATAGGNSVSLTGGTIAANGVTCTVSVSVTASVSGNYTNTIPVGGLTTSQGANGAAASATLAVTTRQPITGSWAIQSTNGGANYLKGNGPAYTLAVTLNNPNTIALTNTSTTFTLPPQLAFGTPNNLSSTCGGSLTSTTTSGTLTGATIPANGNCQIQLDVVAATPNNPVSGTFNLTIAANNITNAQGITNAAAIAGGVSVGSGAFVAKSFSPNTILSGGTSTLTLTFSYANAGSAMALNLTDSLPSGMTIAAIPNVANTCGGLVTAVTGTGSVQLSGGSLPAVAITASAFATCTVKVDVTGVNNGTSCTSPNVVLTNTVPAGNFSGVNYNAASATLTVTPALPLCGSSKSISNFFYAGTPIDIAGSIQTVVITLRNPLAIPDTVVSLTDNLTSPLTVAASPAPTTTCLGGVITAVSGATSFSMAGGVIPASNGTTSGSCTISVPVNVPLSASNTNISNTIPIGGITTVNGSNVVAIGSGNVFVYSPLRIAKAFNPSQGAPNTITQLTITITSGAGFTSGPLLFPLSNITGSDTLPANMVVAAPSAVATTCTGATVTAAAGGNTINFTGVNLNASASCTVTLNVRVSPTAPVGTLTNTIAANTVTSNEGPRNTPVPVGAGSFGNGAATAGFQVVNTSVAVNKTFSPANVPVGTASTLNIQFFNTNPGNITLTGAALTDALPAGMTVANPANASFASAGCAGTVTAAPGASSVSLSGAQINAGATCTLKVNVVASAAGNLTNILLPGALTSAQGISDPDESDATLAVSGTADLSITKTDNKTTMGAGTASTYQIVVSNAGPHNVAGALVQDTPPPGMTFTNWTCTATAGAACGAASGSGAINETVNINVGSTVTYTVTAQIPINYSGTSITNTATVTQPGSVVDANQANNTASDTDTIVSGVVFNLTKLKNPNPTTYTPGTTASYMITAQNTGPANATQVNLFDTLPAGVTLTGTPFCIPSGTASCGTISGAAGQNQFTVAGATLPSGGAGTLTFSVPVAFASSMSAASITNTVSAIDVPSQANATASTPNALLLPSADISVVKTGPATVLPGGAIQYTLLVSNAGPSDANGTTFNDAVPASVTGVAATCGNATGGAVCPAVNVAGNTVSGTLASLPANSSVTITVTGTASSSNGASITNTATVALPANTTDPNTGNNTSTATTAIKPIISLTKTADTTSLVPGGTVNFTVTATNTGTTSTSNVLITDPVAGGITSQSWTCAAAGGAACPAASGSGAISETIATMPPGSSVVYTIAAVISNTPPTNVVNTATATPGAGNSVCAPANTPAPCSATASIPPVPQVGIAKTADTNTVVAGGTIHYTITVSNTGVMPANNTAVSDPAPAGITSQSWTCAASAGANCTASGSGAVTDTIAAFPAGSFVTYTVTAQVSGTPPAAITNTAVATPTAAGTLCTPGNTAPPCSATANVSANPQISIAKSVDAPTITPGGVVHYTVTVTNSGAVAANGTTVSDPIPTGITAQSWTCAAQAGAACTASGTGAISDTLANFPPGSFVTYTVTATVSATPPATIDNTASASPPAGTCAPGNTAPPCTATASSTPLPQVQISKSANTATVVPGGTVTYTVVVSNTGAVAADGTTVSDAMPAGITAQSWSCAATGGATCTASGSGAISDTIVTFPAGATATYTITATVSNAPPASITNTASSTPGANGVCAPGNTAPPCTATASSMPLPQVQISKSANTASLIPGGTVSYTLVVSNTGAVAADGTTVSDPIPAGITSQSWSCAAMGGATCTASGGGAISDTIASFPAGATATYTIVATVSNAPPATITNTASATPGGAGLCAPGNTAAPCTAAVTLGSAPIIEVTKTADTAALVPGGTVHYTVTVSNSGASAADNVLITDPPAGGITSQSWTCTASGGAACPQASGAGGINQTVVLMPSGSSVVYTITASISNTPPTNVSNSAVAMPSESGTVCGPTNTPGPCSATASVPPLPQVSIVKSANVTTVVAGGTIVYTIVVSNSGVMPANNTAVSDPIPAGITSQSWSCTASGGATCAASGTGAITDTIATFPAGSFVTYTVTAQVSANPPATIGNTAVATPPAGTLCTPGNTASPCSASAAVSPNPEISVAKSVDAPTIAPGGVVHYTVVVTNNGSVAADGTSVSDPIPAGITSQSWTCAAQAGATCAASGTGAISDTLATFPPGSFVTYTVTATVSATPPATIANTASATPPAGTCAPGNTQPPCTATASSTPLPQVQLTKTAGTSTLIPGGTVTYTVVVKNTSAVAANGTTVSDPIPAGIAAQSWTCAAAGGATCTASGNGAVTDTIATFPAGATATYTITATVSNAPPATVTNTASSTPGGAGVCAPGNTAAPCTAAVTLGSAPIIEVTKTADTAVLAPGSTVHYTVTISNTGSVAADGTTVSDAMPVGIASQSWACSATGGATCTTSGGGAITDTLATFPAGAIVTYTVTATVSSAPPATITNTVTVTPSGEGVCGVNTKAAVMKALQAKAASLKAPPCTASVTGSSTPQLQVTKTVDLQTVGVGGTVQYNVTVTNGGSVPADGTVVSDPLPEGIISQSWTCTASAGATCTSAGSGAVSDTISALPVGGSVVYTITAKVAPTASKVIENVATITPPASGNCVPCTASAATQVQSAAPSPIPALGPWGLAMIALLMPMVAGLVACCRSTEARRTPGAAGA